MHQPRVAVVGAGVVGLSTALCLSRLGPPCAVTVVADKVTPHTTSDVAAGMLIPHTYPGERDSARRWATTAVAGLWRGRWHSQLLVRVPATAAYLSGRGRACTRPRALTLLGGPDGQSFMSGLDHTSVEHPQGPGDLGHRPRLEGLSEEHSRPQMGSAQGPHRDRKGHRVTNHLQWG